MYRLSVVCGKFHIAYVKLRETAEFRWCRWMESLYWKNFIL